MDPDANLAEQDAILAGAVRTAPQSPITDAARDRLRELRHDLRRWIMRGGFEPDWTRYPLAARQYRYWAGTDERPEPPRYNWQVLKIDDRSIWLRIPADKARPIPQGCHCPHCRRHPERIPAWDCLIVPRKPGSYAVEIHAPDQGIEHPQPVTGPDPRD